MREGVRGCGGGRAGRCGRVREGEREVRVRVGSEEVGREGGLPENGLIFGGKRESP